MVKNSGRRNSDSVRRVVRDVLLSQQEVKRSNTAAANTAWTTAGVVLPISQQIPQAGTIATRSGDKINPKSLVVNLAVASSTTHYLGRIIIFQDTLNVGVDPTVAQVLDGGAYTSTYFADTAQQHRFKIHYDQVWSTSSSATIVTDTSKIYKTLKFKLKGKIFFNGPTNVTASNGPGAVYILLISDVASGAGGYYNYYTTITYTDS